MFKCEDATLVDWLKLQNISLSALSGEERHGIYIKFITSGVILSVGKTNEADIVDDLNNLKINHGNRLSCRVYTFKDNIVNESIATKS